MCDIQTQTANWNWQPNQEAVIYNIVHEMHNDEMIVIIIIGGGYGDLIRIDIVYMENIL